MGLSKTWRIIILLGIDSAFFLVELIVGYSVHSLALVADSFHMLNDVLSLCVGLWAVRVANTESSKMYTYGWQRAETLGALVNGVFLVALCMSIFLEAIQRFVEPQIVTNPKLVLIVGCLGLASNILGLFLFHDHSHGHGGEEHSHDDAIKSAEEGHAHSHDEAETNAIGDEHGNVEDVLPSVRVAGYKGSERKGFTTSDEDNTTISARSSNTPHRRSFANGNEVHGRHRRRTSGSLSRGFGSVDNIHIHPASFRQEIIHAARLEEQSEASSAEEEALLDEDSPNEQPKIFGDHTTSPGKGYGSIAKRASHDYSHSAHNHNQTKDDHEGHGHGGGHGHGHDLNMRGVFLHVLGDALGNIGVIASALIIWQTTFPGRYYFDPGISLVITVIILYSAIPLCKAASRILLQAVPVGMSIDEITQDIEDLPHVVEAHHLHVWQLSDTKLVASLHVKVDCDAQGAGSASYMHLAREIRQCLHAYGIHSSTIQPEFYTDQPDSPGGSSAVATGSGNGQPSPKANGAVSRTASVRSHETGCLLECSDKCAGNKMCCPTDSGGKSPKP
ncbi:CDF family cation efflux system protein [Capronia coronata CBS 617.96]|uniref:CDF family cation efflux system protein n=1 Tax=Capronia coronata CBS 617.96 TaxID=1182541 RepID=W9YFF4_9EURO|nr:CDF family cation efflux system protein [Capronia coronata CBS 617.96]EXJ88375.1 CDF family cation efflux system protein [Capronia coronata CBS 617.96]